MTSTLHRLRDRVGVRAASALSAAVAVALVLVVAGFSLVLVLQKTLTDSIVESTENQARVLGDRIEANFSGTGDAKRNAIDATGKRSDIVQVLTSYGDETNAPDWMVGSNGPNTDVQVIGSSDVLDAQPRIVPWLLAPGETRTDFGVDVGLVDGQVKNAVVVGIGFRAGGRPITVLAAQELAPVTRAVDTVQWLLLGGIPILVLISGYFTYLFAGGALRPVERMRSRVAGMGEKDLSQRVPEPATNDEVGRLARTMNQMLDRIESSQATQRRFVADASHELRSPLATVSTGLELLGSGMAKDSADRATVTTLRGETARLTGLVEGLLFLARADERGLTPRREEVDLDEIVEAERARPSAERSIAVRVEAEPVRVIGDRGQLLRIVRNLVDNALRHAASTVVVTVRADGDLAVIDVDDDGNGVPEADRCRVFERFVRLDEARARGDGGSGLGLSIVAELVAAHGGTITALAAPELGGARFRVTVPMAPATATGAPAVDDDPADEPDEPGASAYGTAVHDGDDPDGPAPGGLVVRPEPERDPWTGREIDAPPATDTPTDTPTAGAPSTGRPVMGGNGARPGVAVPPAQAAPVPDPRDRRRTEPPTGPLPIRPTTVGSPYDENATAPIPVVRPAVVGAGGAAAARTDRPADGEPGGPASPRDTRRPGARSTGAETHRTGAHSIRR